MWNVSDIDFMNIERFLLISVADILRNIRQNQFMEKIFGHGNISNVVYGLEGNHRLKDRNKLYVSKIDFHIDSTQNHMLKSLRRQ